MVDSHVQKKLSLYIDGELPLESRERVRAHLEGCPSCEGERAELIQIRDTLRASPLLTPPESFYQAVHARLEQAPQRSWAFPIKALASACVVLVVVAITYQTKRTPRNEVDKAIVADELKRDARPVAPALNDKDSAEPEAAWRQKVTAPALEAEQHMAVAQNGSSANVARESAPQRSVSMQDFRGALPTSQKMALQNNRAASPVAFGGGAAPISAFAAAKATLAKEESGARATPWKGDDSGIATPRAETIRTVEDWRRVWTEHVQSQANPPLAPEVDFSRYLVIGVFAGQQPRGSQVQIVHLQFGGDAVQVIYRVVIVPGNGITQPFEFRLIPKTDLPVRFIEAPLSKP